MYVSEHQMCILAFKNADLSRLQSEILDLKVAQSTQADQQGMKVQLEFDNTCLKQKLDNIIKEKEFLIKDSESWKEKFQGNVASLQEAHSLITVNLQNLEQYRSEVRSNEERIEKLGTELDEATLSLTSVNRMIEEERKTCFINEQKWHAKEERYLCDMEQLKTEMAVLKTQLEQKDSAQQEVINQVTSLNKELDMFKAIVNIERVSLTCQTNLCMLKMEDHDCQTVTEVQCQQVQTENHLKKANTTQAINASLRNYACQTEESSFDNMSGTTSMTSTQGLGCDEQISEHGSGHMNENASSMPSSHGLGLDEKISEHNIVYMSKNATYKCERENTDLKFIRKEGSNIDCRNTNSFDTQTQAESKSIDLYRTLSDTDHQFTYEGFENSARTSRVSKNISTFYLANSLELLANDNNQLKSETEEQEPFHGHQVLPLITNMTLSGTLENANDNFSNVINYETPEGVLKEDSFKNEIFSQASKIPQEREAINENDEMVAPSQPSIFSDGSWILPTGKKRGLEHDKFISEGVSLVSNPKHFKSDIINEIRDENFMESNSGETLHRIHRVTYPQISKSSSHIARTVDTKDDTQYGSSDDNDQATLPVLEEEENKLVKESKMSSIEQSTSCSKICLGSPSALDENLPLFRTPTICMQSCREIRPPLPTKILSQFQSSEKSHSFSSVVGHSPSQRIPQYRLSTRKSCVPEAVSSEQSPHSVSSPRTSVITKGSTSNQTAYSTPDISSDDIKTEKPKTLLPKFGFLDRKKSIFDEDFNVTLNETESPPHEEAPHVLYSRFLSRVKTPKSSETNSATDYRSPYSNQMPTRGILKDPHTSGTTSPKKVHFSSPLESTVQHQTLDQLKDSLLKFEPTTEDPLSCKATNDI